MIEGEALAALLPHAGTMVLLDAIVSWDAAGIVCRSRSHQDPANPLRRDGRISAVCGVEYALQAAALHGAMLAGGVAQKAGYVARLREVMFHVKHLFDAENGVFGALIVRAALERQEAGGMLYALAVTDEHGAPLVTAGATIALPA